MTAMNMMRSSIIGRKSSAAHFGQRKLVELPAARRWVTTLFQPRSNRVTRCQVAWLFGDKFWKCRWRVSIYVDATAPSCIRANQLYMRSELESWSTRLHAPHRMLHRVAADTETAVPSAAEPTSCYDSVPSSANTDMHMREMGESLDFLCGDELDTLENMESDSSEPGGRGAGLAIVVPPVPPASRLNSCPNSGRGGGDSSGFHSFT